MIFLIQIGKWFIKITKIEDVHPSIKELVEEAEKRFKKEQAKSKKSKKK